MLYSYESNQQLLHQLQDISMKLDYNMKYYQNHLNDHLNIIKMSETIFHGMNHFLEKCGIDSSVPTYFHTKEDDEEDDSDEDDEEDEIIESLSDLDEEMMMTNEEKAKKVYDPLDKVISSSNPWNKTIRRNDSYNSLDLSRYPQSNGKKHITYCNVLVEHYDHINCADCHLVNVMANEALEDFQSCYYVTIHATKLMKLIQSEQEELLCMEVINIVQDLSSKQSHDTNVNTNTNESVISSNIRQREDGNSRRKSNDLLI